jgi:hypothetical protein
MCKIKVFWALLREIQREKERAWRRRVEGAPGIHIYLKTYDIPGYPR